MIKPIEDYILVTLPKEKTTSGGIVLPDSTEMDKEAVLAEVIKVGPGKRNEKGFIGIPVKEGQTVVLKGEWVGQNIDIDGEKFKIVNITEIIATYEKETKNPV